MAVEPEARRRAHEWMEEVYERLEEREALFTTISDAEIKPLYTDEDRAEADRRARRRLSRRVPVHPRRLPLDVPRAPVDDAPVRGLRHRRGDQRALPLPARPRPDRALDRLRHADPDGPRLRPRPKPRRGRGGGGGARHARRHGDALPGHPARRGDGVDDDQRARRDPARLLRRRRRGEGHQPRPARGHDPDRHPQGVHRPEGVVLPDRAGDAPGRRHDRVVDAEDAALAPDLDLGVPHPRGGIDGPAGARLHAQGRLHLRRAGDRAGRWTSTTSRRACRSSSTPTSTSSRRSPSTARLAASGPAR